MKRLWKIAGIAVLVATLGVAIVGVAAFAQGDTTTSSSPFDFATKFREALAGILGISVDEYTAAVDKAEQQVVDQAVSEGWLTQDQADMLQWRLDQAPAGAGLGMGMDMGRGFGKMGMGGPMGDSLTSITADKLGMKLTELLTELQGDKTIADVAKEKGVDTQTIVDAYLAKVKENLDQSVADGNITQKQADYQLEQAKTRVTDQLDNTWQGFDHGGGRHGGMMGPGMGGF
jgi:polyhydroxyalkanoate synthesis regulator phasin